MGSNQVSSFLVRKWLCLFNWTEHGIFGAEQVTLEQANKLHPYRDVSVWVWTIASIGTG